jgi:hypothetical protein
MDPPYESSKDAKRSISTFGTPAELRNTNNMTSLININLVQHDLLHLHALHNGIPVPCSPPTSPLHDVWRVNKTEYANC